MVFDRWLRRRPATAGPLEFWRWLLNHVDAYGAIISLHGNGDWRYRMQVGFSGGTWRFTDPYTHTLVLGPSQSAAGKTAGMVIPTVLSQGGPVVTTSTKFDVARATALARARLGTVWHYDPTGGPCPQGFKELRWSPVIESGDWNAALEIARQMMAASDTASQAKGQTGSEVSHHFQERGGDLLATMLHYAALRNLDMGFVVDRITAYDLKAEILPVQRELEALGADQAARLLRGVMITEDRERSGIFSTVSVALRGYQGTARRSATDVTFSPAAFVKGQPSEPSGLHVEPTDNQGQMLARAGLYPRLTGRYDTIYITMPADRQRLYAPLVVGLLSAIKRATYALNRLDLQHDEGGRRQPVTFVLDEMYGAPLPDLPELLSEGGGQGLLVCGALQDLSQAVARWGEVGRGFLTLWQNVIVMPGIRHGDTLELLSMLVGDYDRPIRTRGDSQALAPNLLGFQRRVWMQSDSETTQRQRILPPEDIYRGNPARKSEVLVFTPGGGWEHVSLQRYWVGPPWPWVLLQSAEWSLRGPVEDCLLPFPELMRGGDPRPLLATGGQGLVDWYRELVEEWRSNQDIPRR